MVNGAVVGGISYMGNGSLPYREAVSLGIDN